MLEALRLTLQHDPNIRLKGEESRQQAGVLQEQSGRFDPTLLGNFSYMLTQTALSEAQIKNEQKRREGVQSQIDDARQTAADAQKRVEEYGGCSQDPDACVITDPGERSQYDTLQQLIRDAGAAGDEAARQEYIRVRNNLILGNLKAYERVRDGANAERAKKEQELADLGTIPAENQQQSIHFDVTAFVPFRDGVTFGIFTRGDWERDRFKSKDKDFDKGGKGTEDNYSLAVGFSVDAPLLRGAGREAAAAFETSARIDFEASKKALQHSATTSLLNSLSAYWTLVGAQESLAVARQSLDLQDKRVEVTKALIDAEELPRVEISRVLAQQATDRSLVRSAERAVGEARVRLARAMGLTVQGDENAPYAADPFPPVPDMAAFDALKPEAIINAALDRRFDHQSFQMLEESGGVLLREAELGLRPKLDVHGEISAGTVAEKSLARTADGWAAPSFLINLTFEKPIGNNEFKGRVLQRDASLNQRAINTTDLERTIKAGIVEAYRSLQEVAGQVKRAQEAVEYYGKTIEAENERYRLGQSSLIDTILTQQLQTSAMFTLVAARQSYATLLAQLLFESGYLVDAKGDEVELRASELLSLPAVMSAK